MLGLSHSRLGCCPGRGRPDLSMQKRTEQMLGTVSHLVIQLSLRYWFGTRYWGGGGESQSDPDLTLLRVSDSFPLFVPWHKWNFHPIFTSKLCRYGMSTIITSIMGKTASKLPQFDLWLRLASFLKNNRWKKKKIKASGLALRVK